MSVFALITCFSLRRATADVGKLMGLPLKYETDTVLLTEALFFQRERVEFRGKEVGEARWCGFHDGRSLLLPFESFHFHHERHDADFVDADGGTASGTATDVNDCVSFVEEMPDSACVASSARRNRIWNSSRSCAALSCAAATSGTLVDFAVPYAHEPATTAATVSPCAMIRTRSQLLNERDWPLRILVMAITRATVVAAAPTGTRGCCLNLRSAFSR